MKTLLSILNYPENSDEFIKYVVGLAQDLNMSLYLMYIQNSDAYGFGLSGTADMTAVQIQKSLADLAESAKTQLAEKVKKIEKDKSVKINIEYSVEIGSPNLIINRLVEKGNVSMIALEQNRDQPLLTLDSFSKQVINESNCPVWIIPDNLKYHPFGGILYATDYHAEDITALNNVLGLTRKYSPKITALHIAETMDFEEKIKKTGFLDTVKERTKYDKIDIKVLTEKDDDRLAIKVNNYAKTIQADLIVLLKENRTFLEKLFNPSSTKQIIKEADLPTLVYHDKS